MSKNRNVVNLRIEARKTKILKMLSDGELHSDQELMDYLSITITTLRNDVEKLINEGHRIQRVRSKGYYLIKTQDNPFRINDEVYSGIKSLVANIFGEALNDENVAKVNKIKEEELAQWEKEHPELNEVISVDDDLDFDDELDYTDDLDFDDELDYSDDLDFDDELDFSDDVDFEDEE